VIGPALLRVAGDWNWWPGGLSTTRSKPVLPGGK
jgi:RND superfamily putative drug exporter